MAGQPGEHETKLLQLAMVKEYFCQLDSWGAHFYELTQTYVTTSIKKN